MPLGCMPPGSLEFISLSSPPFPSSSLGSSAVSPSATSEPCFWAWTRSVEVVASPTPSAVSWGACSCIPLVSHLPEKYAALGALRIPLQVVLPAQCFPRHDPPPSSLRRPREGRYYCQRVALRAAVPRRPRSYPSPRLGPPALPEGWPRPGSGPQGWWAWHPLACSTRASFPRFAGTP